jgi:hypothetical protein
MFAGILSSIAVMALISLREVLRASSRMPAP